MKQEFQLIHSQCVIYYEILLQRVSTVDKNESYYHVLRQPIPVQSLSVHDIGQAEASSSNMKNLFVIVQRNSFQQVIGVFTLQAHTSLGKVSHATVF